MANTTQKKPAKQFIEENPIEALRGLTSGVGSGLVNELGKEAVSDFWSQLLGIKNYESPKSSQKGELKQGQEIDLSQKNKKVVPTQEKFLQPSTEAGIDYRREIIHSSERKMQQEDYEAQTKIQEIMIEINKLATTVKEVQVKFKQVTAVSSQRLKRAGKYHLSFYEFFLKIIRDARLQAESGESWLSVLKSKKAQRGYWEMFKKHGTTFGLSNERLVATQTG